VILRRLGSFDTRVALVSVMTAAIVILGSHAAHAGCTGDSDCEGGRICKDGRCVDSLPDNQAQGSTASQPVPPAPPGPPPMPVPPSTPQPTPVPMGTGLPEAQGSDPTNTPASLGAKDLENAGRLLRRGFSMATGLTEAQVSDLKSAGASLGAKDLETVNRLLRRGFSGDEVVAAYRGHNALRATYPELRPFGQEMVETVAVARKLDLDASDAYWLVWSRHGDNLSLTDAYNRRVSRGWRVLGWITGCAGLAGVVLGALDQQSGGGTKSPDAQARDLALMIGGGVLLAVAIPALIVGYLRPGLPPGKLESTPANRIPSLRASAREPAVRWAVSPLVGPNQASLGLRGSF
jgi:hypothetical protein